MTATIVEALKVGSQLSTFPLQRLTSLDSPKGICTLPCEISSLGTRNYRVIT